MKYFFMKIARQIKGKAKRKPSYPTKKSRLQAIKGELSSNSAAAAFRNVSVSAGGVLNAREPGDLPRSIV